MVKNTATIHTCHLAQNPITATFNYKSEYFYYYQYRAVKSIFRPESIYCTMKHSL